jgi:ribonuclease VapC
MIVDTSVVVAVLTGEPDAQEFLKAMQADPVRRMSAGTYLEICVVFFRRRNPALSQHFDELLEQMEIVVESVTFEQARIAREAYRNFGQGSGHRAKLNYGDCFSYALAKVKREPILFKGDDFRYTDLWVAIEI